MFKYVLKRIGLALVTSVIILSLTFILIKLLREDRPIGQITTQIAYYDDQVHLGYVYRFEGAEHPEYGNFLFRTTKLVFNEQTGKNDSVDVYYYKVPVMTQYKNWIKNILFHFDWGTSRRIQPNVRASVIIGEKLKYSIRINILSVIVSVPVGIALGIWAALKKNTMTDHIISTSVMIFISIPGFVLITLLMLGLCYKTKLLPSQWPNLTAKTSTKIKGYILPVFCASFGSICGYCRYVRAELCEVMESEYLLLARTKGLTRKQSIMRHAMKNAMVPIFPSILSEFIGILGGSMILENLYGIPGIGKLFIESLSAKDYNILFVDMAIFTTISLLAGVVLDISYGFIDPRIRMGAKK